MASGECLTKVNLFYMQALFYQTVYLIIHTMLYQKTEIDITVSLKITSPQRILFSVPHRRQAVLFADIVLMERLLGKMKWGFL